MAVYVYGLTFSDVTAMLPYIDTQSISTSSRPVSTGDITQHIEDGAAKINSAVLDRSNITPDANLDEDTHAALLALVRAYAVAQVALQLGMHETYEKAIAVWRDGYTEYASRPQQLGAAYADGYTLDIDSIDGTGTIDRPDRDDWDFIGFDFKW